jgi:uncharacterized protein YndB with AHSA1/START domain
MGTLVAPDTVRFERLLQDTTCAVAWEHLTKPELIEGWLARAVFEPRLGGKVEYRFDDSSDHRQAGTITKWEPPHVLAYTWHEQGPHTSLVTFELEQAGGAVRLRLTHQRLPAAEVPDYGAGWHAHLDSLILLVARGTRDTRALHLDAYRRIRPRYDAFAP